MFLYRLKSSKQFEKIKRKYEEDEDVLAIQHIYLDEESRHLVVAASQHVIVYGYRKKELSYDVPVRADLLYISLLMVESSFNIYTYI